VKRTINFVEETQNSFAFLHTVNIAATGLHNLNIGVWFSVV